MLSQAKKIERIYGQVIYELPSFTGTLSFYWCTRGVALACVLQVVGGEWLGSAPFCSRSARAL